MLPVKIGLNLDVNALVNLAAGPLIKGTVLSINESRTRKLIAVAKECASQLKIADWELVVWPPENVSRGILEILAATKQCQSLSGSLQAAWAISGVDHPDNPIEKYVAKCLRPTSHQVEYELCGKAREKFRREILWYLDLLATNQIAQRKGIDIGISYDIKPSDYETNYLLFEPTESLYKPLPPPQSFTVSWTHQAPPPSLPHQPPPPPSPHHLQPQSPHQPLPPLLPPHVQPHPPQPMPYSMAESRAYIFLSLSFQLWSYVLVQEFATYLQTCLRKGSRIGKHTNFLRLRKKHVFGSGTFDYDSSMWSEFRRTLSTRIIGTAQPRTFPKVEPCYLSMMACVLGEHSQPICDIQASIVEQMLESEEIEKDGFLGSMSRRKARLLH